MIKLVVWELKKFIKIKWHIYLCLFVLIMPLISCILINQNNSYEIAVYQNEAMSKKEVIHKIDNERKLNSGEINETWLLEMNERLENNPFPRNDYANRVVYDGFWNGYNSYYKLQSLKSNPSVPKLIKNDINENSLMYGPYENWLIRIKLLGYLAMIYCISCIFLFSNSINQEHYFKQAEVNFTSKYGIKKLHHAKCIFAILFSFLLGFASYMVLDISTNVLFEMNGANTTAFMTRGAQTFSFIQLNYQGLALMMLAGLITTYISLIFSSITKSLIVSISLSCVVFIVPYTLMGALPSNTNDIINLISACTPASFISFQNNGQLLKESWIYLENTALPRVSTNYILWFSFILITFYPIAFHPYQIWKKRRTLCI